MRMHLMGFLLSFMLNLGTGSLKFWLEKLYNEIILSAVEMTKSGKLRSADKIIVFSFII